MGGFLSGFLGTLGQRAHESNLLNYQYQHQANEEVAQQLEKMAENARPEFAPEYLQMALKYRALEPGKKPSKDMNLHDIMLRQVQQAHQQEQAQQAAQAGPQANLNRLTPPPDTAATGPQQGFQPGTPESEAAHKAFPNATNPTVTSGPASNPGPALSQLPPQWTGPVPGGDQNLPPPPQFVGRPGMPGGGNAVSGTPNVVAGGAAPSSGFGASLPAPPNYNYSKVPGSPEGAGIVSLPEGGTALSTRYLPEELNQRDINFTTGKQHAINQEELARQKELARFKREQDLQTLHDLNADGQGNYKMGLGPSGLSVQQDVGKPIPGISIDPNTGQAIRTIKYANGKTDTYPVQNFAKFEMLQNPATGQFQKAALDRQGNIIGWVDANPMLPMSMYPTQSSNSHGVVHDVVDPETGELKTAVINVGSTSKHEKIIPGVTPGTTPPFLGGGGVMPKSLPAPPGKGRASVAPKVSTGGPAPTSATTPTFKKGGSIPGVRVIGESPTQRKMELQNPLNTDAQKTMYESSPVLKQVDRAMSMLDKIKDDNTPYTDALKRLGYAVGSANDATPLINNLELGKVIGAARLLKGSSRAYQALQQAMIHLPDPKKDSPKLMYEKLQNIKQNLTDIQDDAQRYGRKYPGLNQPPSMAAPPSDTVKVVSPDGRTGTIPAAKLQDALKRGFKQAQ